MIKYLPNGSLAVPDSLNGGTLTPRAPSGGVAADAAGNVYLGVCASNFTNRIVVFDHEGLYARDFRAGNCGSGEAVKVAVGPDGLLYATRIGPSDEIGVFTPQGTQVRLIGGIGRLNTITARDIDLDAHGNIYVTIRHDTSGGGSDNDEVVRLTQSGQVTGRWQPLPPPYPCHGQCVKGVAAAPDGTVWVTTTDPKRELVHLDADGKMLPNAPHLDVLLRGLAANQIRDVDFSGGNLYVTAHVRAFAVFSSSGELIDSICCQHTNGDFDKQIAVVGGDVLVPGLPEASALSTRASSALCPDCSVGRLAGKPVELPPSGDVETGGTKGCNEDGWSSGRQLYVLVPSGFGPNCEIWFFEGGGGRGVGYNPCPRGTDAAPSQAFLGGKAVGGPLRLGLHGEVAIIIHASEITAGNLVVKWVCIDQAPPHNATLKWELKGQVELYDPSGIVVDARTGKPVHAATVLLRFSPQRAGRFGSPSLSAFRPQVNPQVTSKIGAFGWDVAEGFWRLRISAYGYRPLTSRVYHVPPAVTGLRLKLREDPASYRFLIDPSSSVGNVRLGHRLIGRGAGLRVTTSGGRVRLIRIRSRRFRTEWGVRLGSRVNDLWREYPPPRAFLARNMFRAGPFVYRVGRTTFGIRRRRVVGITLGR